MGSGAEQGLLDSSLYSPTSTNHVSRTFFQDSMLLAHCFFGLQVSYLTWGYLQEKIMTQVPEILLPLINLIILIL